MRFATLGGFLSLMVSSSLWALPFKCDKPQVLCEIQNKRLTIGDHVGVFNEDGQLAAVGTVVEIRGSLRIVKISKKWGQLYRSYEMEIIDDQKAKDPEVSFKVVTPLPLKALGANLGFLNLGVGEGILGTSMEGTFSWWWLRELYIVGRFHYLTGTGEASDNLGNTGGAIDASFSSYGLSAGASQLFMASGPANLRLDGDLGFTKSDVSVSGGFDEVKVLNERVKDGAGLYARLGIAAIWNREGVRPELGFTFVRLHEATGFGLFVGFSSSL